MVSTLGLNDKDIKRFSDTMVKANTEQLSFMISSVMREIEKRVKL